MNETPESSHAPSAMWGASVTAVYEPESGLPPATESAGALVLDF